MKEMVTIKIPTAEEMEQSGVYDDYQSMMIAFAGMHVEAALKAASEQAEIDYTEEKTYDFTFVNKNSILDAYSLTNIQ